jgi:lysophospholipid acyltransferase (LPLAT)-like uncharacterized protein
MEETSKIPANEASANTHFDVSLPQYSRWRRLQIPVIAAAVYGLVRTVSPTLRFEVLGWQHAERAWAARRACIWAHWHCAIYGVLWQFRNRGIVVLNSTNFDGQWMRRVLEHLGYGTAQGSSTRGGLRGLAVLAQRLEAGHDAAFTIDGPRGPRFVAKPGPAMLARRTGCPIGLFHIAYEHRKVFENTWDHFEMPRPFTRAVAAFRPLIEVPTDASREQLEEKNQLIQSELDRIRNFTNSWFSLSREEQDRERAIWNA